MATVSKRARVQFPWARLQSWCREVLRPWPVSVGWTRGGLVGLFRSK
jgi:hypothetical protein